MSGHDQAINPMPDGTSRPGLARKLMAAVRPEFRADVLDFDLSDPVFGGPPCRVAGCPRLAVSHGMCSAHDARWRALGRPDLDRFIATTSPGFARTRLDCCQAPGCRCGVAGHGLCGRHLSAWRRAGRPKLAEWLAGLPSEVSAEPRPICPVPGCGLWAQPRWPFCRSHGRSWIYHGRGDVTDYLARFPAQVDGIPAHERIDLGGLPAQLKLEMQYALQCRRDDQLIKTPVGPVRGVLRFLRANHLGSFLDWSEQAWRERFAASSNTKKVQLALVIYAHRRVEDLLDGRGWDVEYPRDTWRLRNLGVTGARATIAFDGIPQPWLRNLAKRWARWRLSTGKGPGHVGHGVVAITRFGRFLNSPGANVDQLAAVDRALLERYLAQLHRELGGTTSHARDIGQLNAFFDAIRRHGWDDTLPTSAVFFAEDFPQHLKRLPRALSEHVMAQVEDPANLDRWQNPAFRLITLIMMRCGLRISDTRKLSNDCIVHDADGAPYLRYINHKMKREALVPIDEELVQLIRDQQQRVLQPWPAGTPVLFPRPKANLTGEHPVGDENYRAALRRWLDRCDVRDERGNQVRIKPHQWRHTVGTRLINLDIPQEVVRRILDHESSEMTAHYARLHDTTVRRHWERARKVNASGQAVVLDPDGPLAEAAWAKQRLSRATQALPNGYCALPVQQTCPHANACLTCPMFITTAEFLPQHRTQHGQVLQIISTAEARGHTRMAEMNRQVADNLEEIIHALETDDGEQPEAPADAC